MKKDGLLLILLLFCFTTAALAQDDSQPGTLATTLDLVEVDGVMVPIQSGAPVPDFEAQDHDAVSLAGQWKRERQHLDHNLTFDLRDATTIDAIETAGGGRHTVGYDDSGWTQHRLPGVENTMPGDESDMPEPYHDGVWYRRVVDVPSDWAERTN